MSIKQFAVVSDCNSIMFFGTYEEAETFCVKGGDYDYEIDDAELFLIVEVKGVVDSVPSAPKFKVTPFIPKKTSRKSR